MITVPNRVLESKSRSFVARCVSRAILIGILCVPADEAAGQLMFEKPPILYSQTTSGDPVHELAVKIASGEVTLEYQDRFGYLLPLLRELQIPVSSQTLLFSKTSMQRHLISPSNPRAIYFNDEVYVGWIPNGSVIEIASTDPQLGTVFYTIDQTQQTASAGHAAGQRRMITRRTEACLFCHASSETGRVPGLLMQSVLSSEAGNRIFPPADSPASQLIKPGATDQLSNLLAGWYATGTHGTQTHLANVFFNPDGSLDDPKMSANGNVRSLQRWVPTDRYPASDSDLVALLVLRHQVRTHNALTDSNHRVRHAIHEAELGSSAGAGGEDSSETAESLAAGHEVDRELAITIDRIAEQLVDQLLMVGGIRFSSPIAGTSKFAEQFAASGGQDRDGRSLRQLNLRDRLLEHPCSYLIDSASFHGLPERLKTDVVRRIRQVLTSQDTRPKYAHISDGQRRRLFQILNQTHPAFSQPR